MEHPFNIYATDHAHSRNVCTALGKGTGFPVVPSQPLKPGGAAMYGFLRGLLPTLKQAREQGRPWVYVDRGYFRATRGDDYGGYFRVTRNALQHDGVPRGPVTSRRWDDLHMKIAPWRRQGKHVLVCPPGDVWLSAFGPEGVFEQRQWLTSVVAQLKAYTTRPIKIRTKPKDLRNPEVPFLDDLQDCWAVVTHMSNTAVEAALAGVPVFVTAPCAAAWVGERSLANIETPVYPDREEWAYTLADNQWTLDEIRMGLANHLFNVKGAA